MEDSEDGPYTFLLVSPSDGSPPCWYEVAPYDEEIGVMFYNFVGGRCPLGSGRVIKTAQADSLRELDWKGTVLWDDSFETGWLDRRGKFYGCGRFSHISCASYVIGVESFLLEKQGWIHINQPPSTNPDADRYNPMTWTCMKRTTASQRNWLSRMGHLVEDDE